MKRKNLTALLALPFLFCTEAISEVIITDSIDGPGILTSSTDGWTTTDWERQGDWIGSPGLNNFSDDMDDLSPQAGSDFWVTYAGGKKDATQGGIKKFFPGNPLAEGTYTISYKLGRGTGWDFKAPTLQLIADVTGNGEYDWSKQIEGSARTITSSSTPDEGEWSTWTVEYVITASTMTTGGNVPAANALGKDFGILFLTNVKDNQGYALDALQVSFIPEPNTAALLLGAGAFILVGSRRSRCNRR